jgi:hypothetical protein
MTKIWNAALMGLTAALAVIAAAAVLFIAIVDTRPPLIGLTITPLNSPITEGQKLIGHAVREKIRADCPIVSVRTVTNMETGKQHPLAGQVWDGGEAGSTFIDVMYATQGLMAGRYVLEYKINYFCPWAQTFRYDGSMFFTVEKSP